MRRRAVWRRPESRARGLGIDLSPAAAATARKNARALGVGDRCLFAVGDWDEAVAPGWDLVVCNPPYIAESELAGLEPEVRCYDPLQALAAGSDGLAAYRALLPRIPRILAPDGRLALELGAGQADAVAGLARTAGLKPLDLRSDLAGTPRCLLAGSGAVGRKIKKGLE